MQGWVDLCYMNADQPGLNLRPANCKSNSLPLSHRVTRKRYWLAGVKEVGDKQTLRCYWWSRSGSRAEPHRGCRIWWAQRQSWSHAQASCCSRVHTHAWDCAHSNVCANADGGCHWHADRHTWTKTTTPKKQCVYLKHTKNEGFYHKTRRKVLWESTTPSKSWLDLPAQECGQLDKRLQSTQYQTK